MEELTPTSTQTQICGILNPILESKILESFLFLSTDWNWAKLLLSLPCTKQCRISLEPKETSSFQVGPLLSRQTWPDNDLLLYADAADVNRDRNFDNEPFAGSVDIGATRQGGTAMLLMARAQN